MKNNELTTAWGILTEQITNGSIQVDALSEGCDASERADCYRFLTRILIAMMEFLVEK